MLYHVPHNSNVFFFLIFFSKIVELEEELRVVGNNLKSLEVSEEKVKLIKITFLSVYYLISEYLPKTFKIQKINFITHSLKLLLKIWEKFLTFILYNPYQANQREEEYKNQIKTLTTRLKEVCPRSFTELLKIFMSVVFVVSSWWYFSWLIF